MFFSSELLSKRDSGFGLLWLAATLGSQSAFKKLPRRSVLTADITRLCDLITEPSEPLALRLSSNLMFGVVRVYKVKQEILMSDVSNCVTSLKKVANELKSLGAPDGQLQMAQTSIRPSAFTITPDSNAALLMDFDALVAVCITIISSRSAERHRDGDDNLKDSEKPISFEGLRGALPAETIQQDMHTLDEYHEHLLSASFDMSFNGRGVEPSSSQVEQAFDMNDNFFVLSDGIDIGEGLGDELAKELGWSFSPVKTAQVENDNVANQLLTQDNLNFDMDFQLGGVDEENFGGEAGELGGICNSQASLPKITNKSLKHITNPGKENASTQQRPSPPFQALSPTASFSRLLLSQDLDPRPLDDITIEEQGGANRGDGRKNKRTRLLLDARTELTDEELKIARAKYLEIQNLIKHDIGEKKSEKHNGKMVEELVWGVPQGIQARVLVEFWQENFKVQVEARSGALHLHHDEPPAKRRKTVLGIHDKKIPEEAFHPEIAHDIDVGVTTDDLFAMDMAPDQNDYYRGSSEDPGQARRVSRAASIVGGNDLGINLGGQLGSQRSSLFPWDNAAASSSSGNVPHNIQGSQDIQVDHVEVRLRGSSQSRRESSLIPSQLGSILAGPGLSPALGSQVFDGEDYGFKVDKAAQEETQETQKSDLNLVTLERNSFNFLEWA
ncbi:uncharacterized protein LACBIDRAFT_300643 [Laccaria bicolor S238N-H82]|uniref:Predicted protein n=1 Tax=Laccaria bicolor (strain S238N-H82 / ATCC MYA-4686) TaxID=486041 RepID=B0CPS8_LACBS|nr:uncharacterized protein LACBIDRAFT_300643 [Laccaria bicolor S238N-H82]EDR15587.1 predicted protein [Laccaria bicolor S238N-H82]|eukprot:XP_001873795.1 predicted protein [Laccaria bicolor S238N-H82]